MSHLPEGPAPKTGGPSESEPQDDPFAAFGEWEGDTDRLAFAELAVPTTANKPSTRT